MNLHTWSSWPLLITYLKPHRGKVFILTLLLISSTLLQLANPQVIRAFIDAVQIGPTQSNPPLPTLIRLALLFLGISVAKYVVKLAETYVSERIAWLSTNRLRADLTRHCLHLDMTFHHAHPPGELIERIDGDVGQLARFFSQLMIQVVGNLLLMLGILIALYGEDWCIGLAFTIFAIMTVVIMLTMRDFATYQLRDEREASANLFSFLEERLSGTEDIRANGAAAYILHQLTHLMRKLWQKSVRAAARSAIFGSVIVVWFEIGTVFALVLGIVLLTMGAISIGTVYLIYAYTRMLTTPLMLLTQEMQHLQEARASLIRINELYRTESTIVERSIRSDGDEQQFASQVTSAPCVEFQHVEFNYDTPPMINPTNDLPALSFNQPASTHESITVKMEGTQQNRVLRDLSFRLDAGRTLGLLGRTGSGKTTIARLLLRLYEPQNGVIRLGDIDIRDFSLSDLRRRVGIVTQDVQLFNATIRENLTIFDATISDGQIQNVLDELGLGDWLGGLPAGLDSTLEANSGGLSAGEAQLLAFARVLLKEPDLVILDEASSRLDPATERLIDRAVTRLLHQRTGIVIAHRLTTVQRVDEIMILESGQICEHGPRTQLAADADSRFSQLLRTGFSEAA
ncbi:ABC transporter ATP-binding protein/permease [Chloroflexi bacterium TSY]|nr:ABC transporter ATP-binding protein/permease [Chloroflexi bacterium TSY]